MVFSIGLGVLGIVIGLIAIWLVTEITKKVMGQTKELVDSQKLEMLKMSKNVDETLRNLRREMLEISNENLELRRELHTEWKAQSEEIARLRAFVDEIEPVWKRQKEVASFR